MSGHVELNPLITVWKINLNQQNPDITAYLKYLTEPEIVKANRFYFEKDQKRYIQSHAILRIILGEMLGVLPKSLQFTTNSYGKPYLNRQYHHSGLFFNISHSQEGLLVAVSQGEECGIDIEFQRDDFPGKEIAERFFSKNEVHAYLELPADKQKEAFFNCWTRKEAYIKAKGRGLSIPLDSFDVSLVPGEAARLLHSRLEPDDPIKWTLFDLNTWAQYSAALCAQFSQIKPMIKDWE